MTELQKTLEAAKELHAKGFLAACDGNLSIKKSDEEIYITPKGRRKHDLQESDFAKVHVTGKTLSGSPSSELSLHLEIYRRCKEAKAVIHAHPPISIAWTIARPDLKELPANCISELILAVGSVPIAPYAVPGSDSTSEAIRPFLPDARVIIMARHGVVAWGEDIDEAMSGIERVEHAAKVLKAAYELGELTELNQAQVSELKALRAKIGMRTY